MLKKYNPKPLTIRSLLFELAFTGKSIRLERILNKFQYNKHRILISLNYLIKKGYVDFNNNNNSRIYKINKKGKLKILKYNIENLEINNKIAWDHKWRLIIFNIPEKQKTTRNIFVKKLKNMNFICLQKSVFIHPYCCFKEIDYLRNVYEIKKYVKIFTLENIDDTKYFLSEYYKNNHENFINQKNK